MFAAMLPDELDKLESATQYPSIPTYHEIGAKGRLTETLRVDFPTTEALEVTEKIDGTNARIIISPDRRDAAIIGSRTTLLTYLNDLVHNPAEGIVDTVRHTASTLWYHRQAFTVHTTNAITVIYGEVYGGKVGSNARNYTTDGKTSGFRVFDIASVPVRVLGMERPAIAAWRDNGGQDFWTRHELELLSDLPGFHLVPLLGIPLAPPPDLAGTREWLGGVLPGSLARLDDSGQGRPEGVVVRTVDRSRIAKIRFQDYDRTLRVN